jgi:tetratricopeptide (TPR) repeat protein
MFIGCGKKPGTYAVNNANESTSSDARTKADALWAQRGEKDKLAETLSLYEQALSTDTTNKHVLGRLVRGWYFMGDAHESDKTAKMTAWDKAISFGNVCLELNTDYKSTLEQTNDKGEAVKSISDTADVPCMYWYASSLGKWAKLNGILQSLKHKPTFVGFMQQVEKLQPDYFYGAPYRYWGAYFSVLPSFAGRDLDESKKNFDKSLSIAPEYLGTYLLLADNWARNSQNVEEFDQAVQYVMASDPSILPADLLPENNAELKKAELLWKNRSGIFVNPAEAKPLVNQPPKAEEAPAEEAPVEEAVPTEETEPAPEGTPVEGGNPTEESVPEDAAPAE